MYFFVFVAAAAACYFMVAAAQQPRPGLLVAALAWLLYAIYEYFVARGVLCDANCNIRVDLILIWPLVLVASLFGIYAPGRWTGTGKVVGGVSVFLLASMAALSLYVVLVEDPAAERAARAKDCAAEGRSGPECAPDALPGDGATGQDQIRR